MLNRIQRFLVFLVAFACFGVVGWRFSQPTREQIFEQAEGLILQGRTQDGLVLLKSMIRQSPDGSACFTAAQACVRLKNFHEAVDLFLQVPGSDPKRAEACFRAGDLLLLRLHQMTKAELCLKEAVERNPDHHEAQGHLAGIYGLCGLTSLTADLRFRRLCAGDFSEVDLLLLALGDTAAENALSLNEFVRADPEDPLVLLAQAHQAWQHHELPAAKILYETAVSKRPDLDDAQARLGRIYCELKDEAAFPRWFVHLPTSAKVLPETWTVFGDWSISRGDTRGAIRCLWEATRLDATHRRAHHRLGQALASLENANAELFQRRNERLQEQLLAAKQYTTNPSPACILRSIAADRECEQPWEAWGWGELIRKQVPALAANVVGIQRPAVGTPRVMNSGFPGLRVDLSQFPLPKWMETADQNLNSPAAQPKSDIGAIRFTEDSLRTGLRFEYINGDDIPGPGMRIFQFSGGGIGVLDYDRDGWPDLYFTQGGRWPVPEPDAPSDVLFRNRHGESFEEVTISAGIREFDYSQGLAVGDIDADGWEDIFVANVAGNRLFRNNGDGTFEDITGTSQIADDAWSTSAVCADFNGDGLPDLFVVNYLTGPHLLDRICRQSNGQPRACTPHEFEAAEDQLLLNLGDGRFQDVSRDAGVIVPGGKGLGVVAADFEETGQLSLFVGNDTTANFFFQNETVHPGGAPRFRESAVVTGLAFDSEGRPQACMGIAAGDADGDQQMDLVVTNYYDEPNTLYRRQQGLLFIDSTAEAGLREPSIKQLGFGAQFLDADLDGWNDLVVTNGHVDDETERHIPLHMPTQFFQNIGHGRFVEVPAPLLGPWFEGKYLGRSLAKLDWNRDGREDFVISSLDSPAVLLTNQSERRGKSLTTQLVGTSSAREPIGATVQVHPSRARKMTQQLTAGDGYQASNQRQLVFGVGPDQHVEVSVRWPSGIQQTFSDVETDLTWIVIEGRGLYRLP
jgi:tetratricopeptide (TPR) repeat protein